MTKELIRNGGFERGNLDFWSCEHGTAEVVSSVKKRGNYAAKLITGSSDYGVFVTKDYISVSPYELYRALLWLKNVSWNTVYLYIWLYDGDYNLIAGESIKIGEKSGAFDWTLFDKFFAVPIEVSYIILRIYATGTQGSYGYIDSVSLQAINPDKLAVYPCELINFTQSSVSKGTYYGDEFFSGAFKQGDYVLHISKIEDSGTGGLTFKCTVQSYNDITGDWYDAVVFDDVSIPSAGNVTNKVYVKVATAGLGIKQRIKWSLSGDGTPGYTSFKVGVTYKR